MSNKYRDVRDIAFEVVGDWRKVAYAARPYLDAMLTITSIDEMYGAEEARHIVMYFLNNASQWKGDVAKRIKHELRCMVDKKPVLVVDAVRNEQCPRCALGDHGRTRRADGIKHVPTVKRPSMRTIEKMFDEGVSKATDGCTVEPDGVCQHGHQSWCALLGV